MLSVRVLCIHGAGESPEDFAELCSPLQRMLQGKDGIKATFSYYDGLLACRPPKDTGSSWTDADKCRTHFKGGERTSMEASVADLIEYILISGPFDGVLAFSFGASLASLAIMLYDQALAGLQSEPGPLFKFAVFICGSPPQLMSELPTSAQRGISVTSPKQQAMRDTASVAAQKIRMAMDDAMGQDVVESPQKAAGGPAAPPLTLEAEPDYSIAMEFAGLRVDTRSLKDIPTLHVLGGVEDFLIDASQTLLDMCRGRSIFFSTNEGHRMPKLRRNRHRMATTIRALAREGLQDAAMEKGQGGSASRDKERLDLLYQWCKQRKAASSDEIRSGQQNKWIVIAHRWNWSIPPAESTTARPLSGIDEGTMPSPTDGSLEFEIEDSSFHMSFDNIMGGLRSRYGILQSPCTETLHECITIGESHASSTS